MSEYGRTKLVAFSAVTALAALLIAIVSAQSTTTLFPDLLFYGIVVVLICVIVVLVIYAFLWYRATRYLSMSLRRRKSNRLARECFDDFRSYVKRCVSLPEFRDPSKGLIQVLNGLPKTVTGKQNAARLVNVIVHEFEQIVRHPLDDFERRLNDLIWKKKEINYAFLSSLVKEFENYINLHKRLYVDFAVTTVREIGLDNVPQPIKRLYSAYKDDYNQFIIAYTDFAKRSSKSGLRIFSENLQKAYDL